MGLNIYFLFLYTGPFVCIFGSFAYFKERAVCFLSADSELLI